MTKDKQNKSLNVPSLRFPEFSGEWKSCTLGELCDEFQSGKTIKADSIHSTGEYPVYGGNGLRGYTDSFNHSGEYVLIGRQGALCGNIRFVQGDNYITEHAIAVRANIDNNTRFLRHLFTNLNLGQYSDQSAQPGLAVNKLVRIPAYAPQISEQTRIASFLDLLDSRISVQSKIIEEQETLLKSLADKLFRTSNTVTKLRLGDIAELYQPKTIPMSNLSSKGYPVYGANGIIGRYKDFNHATEQICIACRGSSCGSVNYSVPKAWITGNAMVINTDNYSNIIDKRYLFYYLRCINYSSLISGSGQPQIVRAPLAKLIIPVPTLEKQKHEVIILDTVDQKLETDKIILQHYQNQKSYLLSRMFI